MPSKIVPRAARASPTEEELRLAALASIEARRARIAAATAKLEVPASKHPRFAPPPTRRASTPASRHTSQEVSDDSNVRKVSHLKRPATPRFARKAAAPTPACRDRPDPLGQEDLVEASEETLALHRTYGRSYSAHNPTQWNQAKIPCHLFSGERLSRKSRPQARLRFLPGDVASIMIVSRWMSEVAEEMSVSDEISLPEKMSLTEDIFEEDSDDDDWAKAILESLK